MPTPQLSRRLRIGRLVFLLIAGVGIIGGAFLLHRVQVRRQAGALITRAEAAAEKGDWPGAVKLYQSYLNFHPQDAEVVAKYAGALENVAKAKPATLRQLVDVYERLLRLDASYSDQRRQVAKHYLTLGNHHNCRTHLKVLMTAPEFARRPDAELIELWGLCDQRERKFAEAADRYREAIRTGRASLEAHYRLAMILNQEINTKESGIEATQVMSDFVRAEPDSVDRRLLRARYLFRTGEVKAAREDIEFAYKAPGGSENVDVVLALAELALAEDDVAAAKAVLDKAVVKLPAENRLKIALAEAQHRSGETEAAATTLEAAADGIQELTPLLVEIADRLIDQGRVASAARQADRFLADERYKPCGEYLHARIRLSDGNWPEAMTRFRAALARDLSPFPLQHVRAHLELAECHRLANDPEARARSVAEALKIDPSSVAAQLAHAETLRSLGKPDEAKKVYRSLVPRSTDARLAACQLELTEALERPEKDRDFTALEALLGPPPHAGELALVRFRALLAQNRAADAMAVLDETLKKTPNFATGWVALAFARGGQPDEALAILARAEKSTLDRVELRLAKAQLLARSRTPDAAALRALGENAAAFGKQDRYRLFMGLGTELARIGRRADALPLFLRAAAEMPYDLNARLAAFDLAAAEKDTAVQQKMLSELEVIDGADGPTKLLAEATRDLRSLTTGDAAKVADIRRKVETVRAKRESWGRAHMLLGDLDLLENRGDAAVDRYRRAVQLGERNEALVRNLVHLLLDRQGYVEALDLLTRLSRTTGLPPDLVTQLTVLRSAFDEDPERNLRWAQSAEVAGSKSYHDHLIRASVLAVNNKPADARKALEAAVALAETRPEPWVSLVQYLAAGRQTRDAEAAAARAAEAMKPAGDSPADRAAVAVAIGTCRELVGQSAPAEQKYREAVQLAPASLPAHERLTQLLYRTGRPADGDAHLAGLSRSDAADLRRWARRMLALAKVSQPDGFAQIPAALGLIEDNLREGGNLLDDQRTKAIVLAADPFKREEAVALLTTPNAIPLTPEQNHLLGRLQMQSGRYDLAEAALRDATRASNIADPSHLALLVKVQLQRGNAIAARDTVERLKTVAPASWLATVEEARVLTANEKKGDALKLIAERTRASEPAALVKEVGPLLEELKAWPEAEQVYRRAMAEQKTPDSHAALAAHYIRAGRPEAAVELAFQHAATANPGITARLFAAAARSRPPELTPEANRPTWTATLNKVKEWVSSKQKEYPKDMHLLLAKANLDDLFGNYDGAIAAYEHGLMLQPDNPEVLNNLAMLLSLHNSGTSSRPLDLVNKVIARHGPTATILDSRAVVHLAASRYTEAERDLRAALALDPKPVYYFHLAQVFKQLARQQGEFAAQGNEAFGRAMSGGLTKAQLHPKEWGDYNEFTKANR